MRYLLATVAVFFAFTGGAVAVPEVFGGNPPAGVADPEHTFLVTRQLPNENELLLNTFTTDSGYTNDQAIRDATYTYSKLQRTNNPSWRIIIYGPTNGGYYTADDIIWNSSLLS